MDIMEQLLCPQISMDIEDTPIDLGNAEGGAISVPVEDELTDDDKLKILLEITDFDEAQKPKTLTEHEEGLKKTLFSVGPAVQHMKLHCTSCNTHLGSAPINQFDRYIHPLLNVLLCKSCYEFYCSGDFEKDEDGSEMYCRWCGQGGKVMCCSDCAYVFCQKCVRQNLGKKTLDSIKSKDDWQCFACNPQQLINLKLVCHSLYYYTIDEIKAAKEKNTVENLKIDQTICCARSISLRATKRKRSISNEDVPFDPSHLDDRKKKKIAPKKPSAINNASSSLGNELICTPDMPMMGMGNNKNSKKPILSLKMLSKSNNSNLVRNPVAIAPKPKAPILICASTNKPLQFMTSKGSKLRGIQNFMPMSTQQPFEMRSTIRKINLASRNQNKHEWFEQASTITLNITETLTQKLIKLTTDQANAISVEQLAAVHNQLQELLSSSVNQLIHVRKNLRNQFLSDLNKLKSSSKYKVTKQAVKPVPILPKDDEVIVIGNDDEDPLALPANDNSVNNNVVSKSPVQENTGSYLKVKPVSSLMNSTNVINDSRITEQIDLCDDDDDDEPPVCNEKTADSVKLVEEVESSENKENEDEVAEAKKDSEQLEGNPDTDVEKDEAEVEQDEGDVEKGEAEVEKDEADVEKDEAEVETDEAEVEKEEAEVEKDEEDIENCSDKIEEEKEVNDEESENQEEAVNNGNTGKQIEKDEDNEERDEEDEEFEKEGVNECEKEIKSNCGEVEGLNGVDVETYREIQRALIESKFESILEENSKLEFSELAMSRKQILRALSVRVVVDPDYEPKTRRISTNSNNSECQDFEAMLSGSIVVNTSKLISDIENNSEDENCKVDQDKEEQDSSSDVIENREKVTDDEHESDEPESENEGNVNNVIEEKMETGEVSVNKDEHMDTNEIPDDVNKNIEENMDSENDEQEESHNFGIEDEVADSLDNQRNVNNDVGEEKITSNDMLIESDYEEGNEDLLDEGKIEGLIDNLDSDVEEKEEIVNNSLANVHVNNPEEGLSMRPTENMEIADILGTRGNEEKYVNNELCESYEINENFSKTDENINSINESIKSSENSINKSKESQDTFTLDESEETSTEMHVRDIINSLTSEIDETENFDQSPEASTDPVTTDSGIEIDTK